MNLVNRILQGIYQKETCRGSKQQAVIRGIPPSYNVLAINPDNLGGLALQIQSLTYPFQNLENFLSAMTAVGGASCPCTFLAIHLGSSCAKKTCDGIATSLCFCKAFKTMARMCPYVFFSFTGDTVHFPLFLQKWRQYLQSKN